MKLTKEIVLAALSHITLPNDEQNIVESGAIKNIHIFGTDVELDVEIKNPTLQYKKKVEVDCMKAVHDYAYEKSVVKINLIINAPEKVTQIKGNPIPNVKNIIEKKIKTINENLCLVSFFKNAERIAIIKSSLLSTSILF